MCVIVRGAETELIAVVPAPGPEKAVSFESQGVFVAGRDRWALKEKPRIPAPRVLWGTSTSSSSRPSPRTSAATMCAADTVKPALAAYQTVSGAQLPSGRVLKSFRRAPRQTLREVRVVAVPLSLRS